EAADGVEELTAEELQPLLEAERQSDPADQSIIDVTPGPADTDAGYMTEGEAPAAVAAPAEAAPPLEGAEGAAPPGAAPPPREGGGAPATPADPFEEIDFGSYFDDYLDPGYKSPAAENSEKPSFETFLSSPVTLSDHLHSQLALVSLSEEVRDAAESIIGNLNENGYLTT